jgi:hypothetical protein
LRRCLSTGSVSVRDLEADAGNLDVKRAGEIYREHGCLVVRGLNVKYVEEINRAVELQAKQSIELLPGKKEIPVWPVAVMLDVRVIMLEVPSDLVGPMLFLHRYRYRFLCRYTALVGTGTNTDTTTYTCRYRYQYLNCWNYLIRI